jgi:hypothetical protein
MARFLILFFLVATYSFSFSNEYSFSVKNIRLSKTTPFCSFKGLIPTISILKGKNKKQLQEKVNQKLKTDFTKELSLYQNLCKTLSKEKIKYSVNLYNEVTLINDQVISIFVTISEYEEGSAHPNNTYKSFNYSLLSMEPFKQETLVHNPDLFLKKVNSYIAEELVKRKVLESVNQYEPKEKFDMYFTKNGVVIFNLFYVHVLQSLEVEVLYPEIKTVFDHKKLGL